MTSIVENCGALAKYMLGLSIPLFRRTFDFDRYARTKIWMT